MGTRGVGLRMHGHIHVCSYVYVIDNVRLEFNT